MQSFVNVEELLTDFCDFVGEHSGENMAPAVFETMELFGLKGCMHLLSSGLITK